MVPVLAPKKKKQENPCQMCHFRPVLFTNDFWPSCFGYLRAVNTRALPKKSHSSRRAVQMCSALSDLHQLPKSINRNSSSEAILISQFYRLIDVPSMWHIIPIFKDQTLQLASVSITLRSNQEGSWRLPFIWLDNLFGRLLADRASIGDIYRTLSFDVRQEVGV